MLEIVKGYLKKREVEYKENVLMSNLSTVRIGNIARVVAFPKSTSELTELTRFLSNNKIRNKIVGRMSNIVPSDTPYEGVLIRITGVRGYFVSGNTLTVNAGESLSSLACNLARSSLGGLEELSGIPGTVGGAIVGNAGAFGREISELVKEVRVFDKVDNVTSDLSNSELNFSYRSSLLKNDRFVVLSAKLKMCASDSNTLLKRLCEFGKIRKEKQPAEPSSGSVFKRPVGYIAAKLIDECGLKGTKIGGAVISEKHAGFIVNRRDATAKDYSTLCGIAEEEVFQRFGVRLEREVEFL